MSANQEQERQRLFALYAAMSDEELESIAQESAELTELARAALRSERDRRGLQFNIAEAGDGSGDAMDWEDLVVIKQFRDLPEALLAKGSLESAGIECFLVDDNMVRMDWFISNLLGGAKLCVRPEDADAAFDLLEQPIPADFDVEGVGNFEQPVCPQCGSVNVSYESLNKPASYATAWAGIPIPVPRKRWKCQNCGHTWKEAAAET